MTNAKCKNCKNAMKCEFFASRLIV